MRCLPCRKEETRLANIRKREKHDPRTMRERAEIERLIREEGDYVEGLLTFGADVPFENYVDLLIAAFSRDETDYPPVRGEFATRLPRPRDADGRVLAS